MEGAKVLLPHDWTDEQIAKFREQWMSQPGSAPRKFERAPKPEEKK